MASSISGRAFQKNYQLCGVTGECDQKVKVFDFTKFKNGLNRLAEEYPQNSDLFSYSDSAQFGGPRHIFSFVPQIR